MITRMVWKGEEKRQETCSGVMRHRVGRSVSGGEGHALCLHRHSRCEARFGEIKCIFVPHRVMHDEVSDTENIRKNLAIERTIVEGCDILLDTSQTFIRQGKTFLCRAAQKSWKILLWRQQGSHCHRQAGHCTGHCQHPEPAGWVTKCPENRWFWAVVGPQVCAAFCRKISSTWVAKPPRDCDSHSAWTVVPRAGEEQHSSLSLLMAALETLLKISYSRGGICC